MTAPLCIERHKRTQQGVRYGNLDRTLCTVLSGTGKGGGDCLNLMWEIRSSSQTVTMGDLLWDQLLEG